MYINDTIILKNLQLHVGQKIRRADETMQVANSSKYLFDTLPTIMEQVLDDGVLKEEAIGAAGNVKNVNVVVGAEMETSIN